jgi:hypothetical protein
MARIRTIKPEFPQSESMGRVSRDSRLLFVLLWTLADDDGRLRGSSRILASLLFPYDDDAKDLMDAWLSELEREECIVRYMIDKDTYLQILNWNKHQKIDKPSASKIPAFDESSRTFSNPREASSEDQGPRTKDQGPKDLSPLTPQGELVPPAPQAEKPPRVKKLKTTELKPESVEAFQAAWETIPASVVRWDANVRRDIEEAVAKGSRAEAERNFQAIVDAKIATPRTLYVALYAYITEGEGPRKGFVQHCATFYGPKKRTYLEWLERARELESERYGVSA